MSFSIRPSYPIAFLSCASLPFFLLVFSHSSKPKEPSHTLSIVAGVPSGQGYRDGAASVARFSYPMGLTATSSGAIIVADMRNCLIRSISSDGLVSTLAGTIGRMSTADGHGSSASFSAPLDVVADSAGNIYVADSANHTIRKIDPTGAVTTFAGTPKKAGSVDGTGGEALFNSPGGLALDSSGNLYVADSGNHTIRKISPTGTVTTLAGKPGTQGSSDGQGSEASFNAPGSLAVDASGNIYVADSGNNTIRKITPDGTVTTLAGVAGQTGSADGPGNTARFAGPGGIVSDSVGNLYIADTYNNAIRKLTPDGTVTTLAGSPGETGSVDGFGASAQFKGPARITWNPITRALYVTDNNSQVRRITAHGVVTTLTGAPAESGTADGPATSARFSFTNGIAIGAGGNLYVADMDNGTIRQITRDGVVSTFAGTPGKGGNADGTGAAAQFGGVGTIAADRSGTLYVAEFYNDTIRKVTSAGVVTTFAGASGKAGRADGTGTAAQFAGPNDVAMDTAGNLYVADFYANTIRKITPDAVVTTLAGTAGKPGSSDGTGAAALFDGPAGVAADDRGNLYVTELNNHTLRKISPNGTVTTLAGHAGEPGSADGPGTTARFSQPWGIALDSRGNIYVCDTGNNAIRKIAPNGNVTTVVGGPGPYWNLPGKLPAKLAYPIGITVDPSTNDLYITIPDAVMKVKFD